MRSSSLTLSRIDPLAAQPRCSTYLLSGFFGAAMYGPDTSSNCLENEWLPGVGTFVLNMVRCKAAACLVWSGPAACSLPASPNRHPRRFRMLRLKRSTLSAAGHPVPGHLHATDCARKHAHRAGVGGPRLRWVTVERY